MARLKVKKHFSLAYLGDEWKDAYINFTAFTANDIKSNSGLKIDVEHPDPVAVQSSFDNMIKMLQERFIDGQLPNDDGTLAPLKKEEIGDLDMDIIQGAITFLSQATTQPSLTQSVKS